MDNIYLKKISKDDKNFYNYYHMAVLWDKKKKCFSDRNKDYDFIGMFEEMYLLYLNDNIIGYGIIFYAPKVDNLEDEAYLSCIIKPEYRKKGYGYILLKMLEGASMLDLNVKKIKVEILKSNIPSITLVENSNYEFEYFDNNKIVFKKELK